MDPSLKADVEACHITPKDECIIYHMAVEKDVSPLPQINAFKDPRIQFLPFLDPLINYLLATPCLNIYKKLIKSCKYFYSKKKVTVIPVARLYYLKTTIICDIREDPILELYSNQISKIWITINLDSNFADDQKSLSNFCTKIYKCQARIINIYHQELTEAEFKFLAQPEFVLCLMMEQTLIAKRDGTFMGIVDVLKRVPNVREFEFTDPSIMPQTFFKLSEFPGKNRLMHFSYGPCESNMHDFQANFSAEMFQIFVTKTAMPNAEFKIFFGYTTQELFEVEEEKIKHFTESWIPQEEKPKITMWKKIQKFF